MARSRIIRPNFARSSSMCRVSRDARLLFILLWTLADDAGRLRAEPLILAEELYPSDTDAPMLLVAWLDELEREGCIERYRSGDEEYLRIVRWRRYQKVDHPRLSRLPAAASEAAIRDVREIREESPESQPGRASRAKVREFDFSEEEAALLGRPFEFTKENVRAVLSLMLRKSIVQDSHTAASRLIEQARREVVGTSGGKAAPAGKQRPESLSPSPAELLAEDDGA
jgi:hypothetical protein